MTSDHISGDRSPRVRSEEPDGRQSILSDASSRLMSFSWRSRCRAMATLSSSREILGSASSSFSTLTGFLESNQLMSLQEDAKSRIISSEVLKRHLHESVITASNRPMRLSVSSCQYNSNLLPCRHCVTQSVPVTPMHNSQEVSPSATPTPSGHRQKYYRFFSRGTTPKCTTPIEENGYLVEEESPSVGLASLFDQQPLNFALNRCHIRNTSDIECDVIAEVQITPP